VRSEQDMCYQDMDRELDKMSIQVIAFNFVKEI
jgi:hypothetical protein